MEPLLAHGLLQKLYNFLVPAFKSYNLQLNHATSLSISDSNVITHLEVSTGKFHKALVLSDGVHVCQQIKGRGEEVVTRWEEEGRTSTVLMRRVNLRDSIRFRGNILHLHYKAVVRMSQRGSDEA